MSEPRRFSLFPKTLGGCVEPLTRPLFRQRAGSASHLLTFWPSIVGERLAKFSHPEKLDSQNAKRECTLTIAVQSGFATEVQYMTPMILERIADFMGNQSVRRIVISHSANLPVDSPKKKQRPVKKITIDSDVCEAVEDEELRKRLLSFAAALEGKES